MTTNFPAAKPWQELPPEYIKAMSLAISRAVVDWLNELAAMPHPVVLAAPATSAGHKERRRDRKHPGAAQPDR